MSNTTRSPSYLIRNPFSYCFRLKIPRDLQEIIGRKELRYSLKTRYVSTAKSKSGLLAGNIKKLFYALRSDTNGMSKLTPNQIQEIINEYTRNELEQFENERITEGPRYHNKQQEHENYIQDQASFCSMLLTQCEHSGVSHITEKLLKKHDISIEQDGHEFNSFCRELIKSSIKMYEVEMKRNNGDYSDDVTELFPLQSESQHSANGNVAPQSKHPTRLLSKIIEDYTKENLTADNWKDRTQTEYANVFKNIVLLMGDVPVNTIKLEMVQKFKDILMVLPTNYFKSTTKFKDTRPEDFLKNKPDKTLSVTTINKYLTNLSAIFNYAVRNGFMETDFAQSMKIKQKKQAKDERDIFSDEDLKALFYSGDYINDTFNTPWKFWIPILGLYTGCRLEELCQLAIDDIIQKDDVWCLDIHGNVKTESSKRKVPLHPFISEILNFLNYVKLLRTKGSKKLFPELRKQSGRLSHYPSRWFGIYKNNCGITSKKKVFHSFRHNFSTNLNQQGVSPHYIDQLTGHAHQGMSMGRYVKEFDLNALLREVSKLAYPIDLTHLSKSKYV